MAEQVRWDGHLWTVELNEHQVWIFTRPGGKRRFADYHESVPLREAATVEEAVAVLEARALAKLAKEREDWQRQQAARRAEATETLAGQRSKEAGYQRSKAILGALESGMSQEQIAAALEGRPHRPGRKVERCPRCGATGYAGQYPFSTGYDRLCDDCGG